MSQRLPSSMSTPCTSDSIGELHVPFVEAVAQRAAALVLEEREPTPTEPSSPYLGGWQAAADYLALLRSTLTHATDVPRRKVGGAVIFDKREPDAWAAAYFEGSPRFHVGSTRPQSGTCSGIASARPPANYTQRVGGSSPSPPI